MSADAPAVGPVRPPFYRDIRVVRWLVQIAVVVVVLGTIGWLISNVIYNLEKARLPLDYRFLSQPYGVDIPGSSFSPRESVLAAFLVGYANTIRVIAFGIPACTIIGILIGIARLSQNVFVRGFGTLYVETFRNVPVLLWILLANGPLFTLGLPTIANATEPLGIAVLSNKGMWVPWLRANAPLGLFVGALGVGILAAVLIVSWRRRVNERTGAPARGGVFALIAFLVIAAVGFVISGSPLDPTVPTRDGRVVTGGINVFVNYAALTVALTLYTASHVAEIVRGAILAVPKGQTEAANALALRAGQRYRHVVLPQAFRIMIPPLASQFLNLTKNSSLGVAIGYYEITRIYSTAANNAAPAVQAVTVLMALYLTFSLGISLIANIINRRLMLESR